MKLSDVISENIGVRLDAEFYKKEYKLVKAKLLSVGAVPLKTLISSPVITGHTPSMANRSFYGGRINFIKTDNLRDNFIHPEFTHTLSDIGNDEIKNTSLQRGDVILTIIGATFEVVGRACLIKEDVLPANINQNIALIRLKEQILPDYLSIYLNTKYGKKYLHHLSRQTEQVNLNCREVEQLLVPTFHSIQDSIKNIVNKAHDILKQSKALYAEAEHLLLSELGLRSFVPSTNNKAVKSYRESFLQTRRFDAEFYQPKYDEIETRIKSLDCGWGLIKSYFEQNKTECDLNKSGYNYIEIGDINTSNGQANFNYLATEDLPANAKVLVEKGDLLISKVRPYRGAISIIDFEMSDLVVSGAFTVLRAKGYFKIETLAVLLRTDIYKDFMLKFNVGSSYPVIKDEDVLNLPIPLVDRKIQVKIADRIKKSGDKIKQSRHLLETTKRAVEIAIEENEQAALQLLETKLRDFSEV